MDNKFKTYRGSDRMAFNEAHASDEPYEATRAIVAQRGFSRGRRFGGRRPSGSRSGYNSSRVESHRPQCLKSLNQIWLRV